MMLGIRDPRRRVAQYLLLRDERCMGTEIHLGLEDIAASVGLRPETVSRAISSLSKEGLVERVGRGRLRLLDRSAIRRI